LRFTPIYSLAFKAQENEQKLISLVPVVLRHFLASQQQATNTVILPFKQLFMKKTMRDFDHC
jgi:hypothetical protein